ncbi:MarR family transcriptional regulator [Phytohabitans sp. ZYX-F-186]|uniref:MarR family transcriptional regulator n=1 Tax=Phytohabitans maris TaxID=3071409 RepID=A0ABU0ZDM3_9ACTN|nr:MarR family transcriptional regulator [Phytohabitans sp. ZYX-F-186]MDQ7905142.1 MarR family transcriptional regulator [Phytohabitans sp. ZYX-F-186]
MATTMGLGVAAALVRTSHLVQRVFGEVARAHGLPPQQLQLLCVLVRGPVGMTELGRLMHLERSTMTGLVDRVEKRRLVTRVSDPTDRRACVVRLSDEGSRLAVAAHDEVTTRLESMTEVLDPGERGQLVAMTTRVLAAYDPSWAAPR